ncbi:hypothetical protein QBC46DRAFT_407303 [Diplogelasinospora grovesii]|uniref:F-box domain-containing protein n=1 Tax=Diplogelasinospora grovesii TaxID=303347 RepID=A0AAN6N918_9PEZI|nr:hypothetical protein QBC46DRAFT_407303 [Diplogelasinospora grovesii]
MSEMKEEANPLRLALAAETSRRAQKRALAKQNNQQRLAARLRLRGDALVPLQPGSPAGSHRGVHIVSEPPRSFAPTALGLPPWPSPILAAPSEPYIGRCPYEIIAMILSKLASTRDLAAALKASPVFSRGFQAGSPKAICKSIFAAEVTTAFENWVVGRTKKLPARYWTPYTLYVDPSYQISTIERIELDFLAAFPELRLMSYHLRRACPQPRDGEDFVCAMFPERLQSMHNLNSWLWHLDKTCATHAMRVRLIAEHIYGKECFERELGKIREEARERQREHYKMLYARLQEDKKKKNTDVTTAAAASPATTPKNLSFAAVTAGGPANGEWPQKDIEVCPAEKERRRRAERERRREPPPPHCPHCGVRYPDHDTSVAHPPGRQRGGRARRLA